MKKQTICAIAQSPILTGSKIHRLLNITERYRYLHLSESSCVLLLNRDQALVTWELERDTESQLFSAENILLS